jgi:hypothetical protein
MSLTGIDFVLQFDEMLDCLDKKMPSELRHTIFSFRYLDPHDLVGPDHYFPSQKSMLKHLASLIWIVYLEGDPTNRN